MMSASMRAENIGLNLENRLTIYAGRAGDRNPRAMRGAAVLGAAVGRRLGLDALLGVPQAPLGDGRWKAELEAALAALGRAWAASAVLARSELVGLDLTEFEATWPDGREASPDAFLDAIDPLLTAREHPT